MRRAPADFSCPYIVDDAPCGRTDYRARGLCTRCIQRAGREGTLENYPVIKAPKGAAMALLQDLAQIESDDCIEDRWPEGWFRYLNGRPAVKDNGRSRTAAQVLLEISGQPKPTARHQALHRCNHPECLNVRHLYWGTHRDNMDDMVRAGSKKGSRHGGAKLTEDDVRAIRARYVREFTKNAMNRWRSNSKELAAEYGVSPNYVNNLVRRDDELWSHV